MARAAQNAYGMNVSRDSREITAQGSGVQVRCSTAAGDDNDITDILLLAGIAFLGAQHLQIDIAAAFVADRNAPGIGITVKVTKG